jgi:hypothetical protein
MMRRIISEYNVKHPANIRPTVNYSNDLKRTVTRAEREAYKKGRQDARSERPPYYDRQLPQAREQGRYIKPSQSTIPAFRQRQAPNNPQPHGGQQTRPRPKHGAHPDSRQRPQDRRAFGAAESRDEDAQEAPYDSRDHQAFSASRMDNEDHEDEEGEERHAMMGRRDYDFNGSYESDEGET